MVMQGRVVRSWTDYILGSDCWIFENVAAREPRHNSQHLMVIGCLRSALPREHSRYLGRMTRLPLCPTGPQMRMQAEKIFAELRCDVTNPGKRAVCHNLWILAEMLRLVNERVSTRR